MCGCVIGVCVNTKQEVIYTWRLNFSNGHNFMAIYTSIKLKGNCEHQG